MKNKLIHFLKTEAMLAVAAAAAILSLFITPPGTYLLSSIDWKTLATLFMLLSVLDGFRYEDLFLPVIRLADRMGTLTGLGFFLVFSVFLSSMFVTNDVSLIIFVPLTILLFRSAGKEQYILPLLALENTAAVRGSLLTPFGSPQNLFLYSRSGISASDFMKMMLPLWLISIVLLCLFLCFVFRRDLRCKAELDRGLTQKQWDPARRGKRILYFSLFSLVIVTIVSRTALWPLVLLLVIVLFLIFDRSVFRRVDYSLLLTFFCFFVFSSSVAANPAVGGFLERSVAGREYLWSILISQVISNVPASIVLWPFTTDLRALLYGLDTAGLVSVIGSLASVINLRLYVREYPGRARSFLIVFELYSLAFFVPVFLLQYLWM